MPNVGCFGSGLGRYFSAPTSCMVATPPSDQRTYLLIHVSTEKVSEFEGPFTSTAIREVRAPVVNLQGGGQRDLALAVLQNLQDCLARVLLGAQQCVDE